MEFFFESALILYPPTPTTRSSAKSAQSMRFASTTSQQRPRHQYPLVSVFCTTQEPRLDEIFRNSTPYYQSSIINPHVPNPDKTCTSIPPNNNAIPVRVTQRTTDNGARRTSNPNNLIYPRSDLLPVNPTHQLCHFVPSIILANVMSQSPKTDEIRLYVQDHDPDIMCLTETWLKDTVESSVIHITNYTLVRKDRIYAQHGGVCLYIKESIPFTVLREYERDISIEVLWCKLCPRRLPCGFSYLVVGVAYHPPTADDEQMINYLINTLSEIESSMPNAAIILAGDFNRLNTAHITIQFHLKQLVKFPTRGERTLDLILTNLNKFYQAPTKDSTFLIIRSLHRLYYPWKP